MSEASMDEDDWSGVPVWRRYGLKAQLYTIDGID